jgi:hypothetical protein
LVTKNKHKFVTREEEEYLRKIAEICENVNCKYCGRFNVKHCRPRRNCGSELRPDYRRNYYLINREPCYLNKFRLNFRIRNLIILLPPCNLDYDETMGTFRDMWIVTDEPSLQQVYGVYNAIACRTCLSFPEIISE